MFELELLSGITIVDAQDLRAACAALAGHRRIDCRRTGCTLTDTPTGRWRRSCCADGQLSRFATPRLPIRPYGNRRSPHGLIRGASGQGQGDGGGGRLAVETVFAVLVRHAGGGTAEMRLVTLPTRKP
jgi:pyridoxine kinase